MNRAAKSIFLFVAAIGLTLSYSVFDRLVPDTISHTTLVIWSLLAPTMLMLHALYHALYRLLVNRKPLCLAYGIAIKSKRAVSSLGTVIALAGLAIVFPSVKHDSLDMLYIIGIGVIGEEILFRGLLWDMVDNHLGGDTRFLGLSGTIWLTALAFGATHFQYHQFQAHLASVTQMGYSFVVGLALGVIRERTQSVVWPIFAHSGCNSLFNLAFVLLENAA
jgi:membrane protease YdiL (CAAX protease family)